MRFFALACEEIVMSPDALLGPVAPNKKRADDTVRAAYKDIAGRRRTVPPPLALALVDPSLRVVRVITEVGDQIVLSERVPDLREEVQVFQVEDIGARPLVLSGRRCREIGVVQLLVKGTTDLARSLDIDPERLVIDPSMERVGRLPLSASLGQYPVTMLQGFASGSKKQSRKSQIFFA